MFEFAKHQRYVELTSSPYVRGYTNGFRVRGMPWPKAGVQTLYIRPTWQKRYTSSGYFFGLFRSSFYLTLKVIVYPNVSVIVCVSTQR